MALFIGIEPGKRYRFSKLKEDIIAYWGTLADEIGFPVYVSQLRRWIDSSPTHTVAMRVENFSDPATLTADWVIIDTNNLPTDWESVNIHYAVLNESTFTDISNNPGFQVINARFARHAEGQAFYVFFNKSKITPKEGGASGDPESSGAVVR